MSESADDVLATGLVGGWHRVGGGHASWVNNASMPSSNARADFRMASGVTA